MAGSGARRSGTEQNKMCAAEVHGLQILHSIQKVSSGPSYRMQAIEVLVRTDGLNIC